MGAAPEGEGIAKDRERVEGPYRPASSGEQPRTDEDFLGWRITVRRQQSTTLYVWIAPDGREFTATAEPFEPVPIPPKAEEHARRLNQRR